ncbi:phosphodiesterase [Isoalcanivorax indicus]|uniref:phosphodiesterase n=1 Tax=Isoalcanivorax indicus TaxID=2202653 RepID=UPI0013C50844|nr:phosphodiesterase [Isoalcanivorax indicus]
MNTHKLLWITDLHLVEPGHPWPQHVDPLPRLHAVLNELRDQHEDADRLILTGDLVQSGSVQSYQVLRDVLQDFPIPWRLLVGNHDKRDNLREVFPRVPVTEGFLQFAEELDGTHLIYLDTQAETGHHGELCPARLAWLAAQLQRAGASPVLIFMHHPPVAIGMPPLDRLRLRDPDNAFSRLLRARAAPTQLLCGHLHRNVSGRWAGHPFTVLDSTHLPLRFDMVSDRLTRYPGAPTYGVILLDGDSVVINAVQQL